MRCRLSSIVAARALFRALLEQRCGRHPRLSQFEKLPALLFGTRHACRRNAFVSDFTVLVGLGHPGVPKRMPSLDRRRRITLCRCTFHEPRFYVTRRSAGIGLLAFASSFYGDF